MRTKLAKWGNSLAVRIPSAFVEQTELSPGDSVEVSVRDGEIVISARPTELRMADLLSLITDNNIHEPVEFGPARGKELI